MLGSPRTSCLALPKSHSFSTWLAVFTSRFCTGHIQELSIGFAHSFCAFCEARTSRLNCSNKLRDCTPELVC